MRERVLVFSADPGGAECLAPVVQALADRYETLVLSRGSATATFARLGLPARDSDEAVLQDCLHQGRIRVVLTSASSLPEKDMAEKRLWRWAENRGIPSLAVLDQWQSYVERFSGPSHSERLAYLPNAIAVMDRLAYDELICAGLPANRLIITGQPALEGLAKRVAAYREEASPPDHFRLTFFSQPLRDLFGTRLGYDEHSVLKTLLSVIEASEGRYRVTVKLHPKQRLEDFASDVPLIRGEVSNDYLMANSDLVVGISSIMLAHAVLAGIPTVSYEPAESGLQNRCIPVAYGAIPQLRTPADLHHFLTQWATDSNFRSQHRTGLARFPSHEGASKRVVDLLEQLKA